MAAQIIAFPKLESVNGGKRSEGSATIASIPVRRNGSPTGLHVLHTSSSRRSQQTAQRIVQDVCLEHDLPHPALDAELTRTPAFWANLPVPPARVETPFSVAKRLAHIVLPMAEHA